jgi:hypothetical protein
LRNASNRFETFTLLAIDDLGQRVRGCVHVVSVQMPRGVIELRGRGCPR